MSIYAAILQFMAKAPLLHTNYAGRNGRLCIKFALMKFLMIQLHILHVEVDRLKVCGKQPPDWGLVVADFIFRKTFEGMGIITVDTDCSPENLSWSLIRIARATFGFCIWNMLMIDFMKKCYPLTRVIFVIYASLTYEFDMYHYRPSMDGHSSIYASFVYGLYVICTFCFYYAMLGLYSRFCDSVPLELGRIRRNDDDNDDYDDGVNRIRRLRQQYLQKIALRRIRRRRQ